MSLHSLVAEVSMNGSIGVTQRLRPGRRPDPFVQVMRCVSHRTRGLDGNSYGRTENVELLRLPSGTRVLLSAAEVALRGEGLTDPQIEYINDRLPKWAERAEQHELAFAARQAERHIVLVESIAQQLPATRAVLQTLLASAATRLAGDAASTQAPPSVTPFEASPSDVGSTLLSSLRRLNQATADVQVAYRQLPKGDELQEAVVLEFQRSWFLVPAMVEALRGRECFYRPRGWSELKQQVLEDGRAWRKGDPLPQRNQSGEE